MRKVGQVVVCVAVVRASGWVIEGEQEACLFSKRGEQRTLYDFPLLPVAVLCVSPRLCV